MNSKQALAKIQDTEPDQDAKKLLTVPLVYEAEDGTRTTVGKVEVGQWKRTHEIVFTIDQSDGTREVVLKARYNENYRYLFSTDAEDFSIGDWAREVEARSGLD